jgi:hypothetical protein
MFGLIVIVAVVALALFVVIRAHNQLAALRRRTEESDEASRAGAIADYNAARQRFPASMLARTLGFHELRD